MRESRTAELPKAQRRGREVRLVIEPFIWRVTGDAKTTGEMDEMSGTPGNAGAPASGP